MQIFREKLFQIERTNTKTTSFTVSEVSGYTKEAKVTTAEGAEKPGTDHTGHWATIVPLLLQNHSLLFPPCSEPQKGDTFGLDEHDPWPAVSSGVQPAGATDRRPPRAGEECAMSCVRDLFPPSNMLGFQGQNFHILSTNSVPGTLPRI